MMTIFSLLVLQGTGEALFQLFDYIRIKKINERARADSRHEFSDLRQRCFKASVAHSSLFLSACKYVD